jgi:O-antigen ligase
VIIPQPTKKYKLFGHSPVAMIGIVFVMAGAITGITGYVAIGVIVCGLKLIYDKLLFSNSRWKEIIVLNSLPLVALMWCINDNGLHHNIKSIETYAGGFFITLLLTKSTFTKKQLETLAKIFCYLVILVYCYALIKAFYNYHYNVHQYFQIEFFFYTDLANNIAKAHPSYLAFVGAVASTFAFKLFRNGIIKFCFIVLITLMIVLLNARMVLITHLCLTLILVLSLLKGQKFKVIVLSIIGILLVSVAFFSVTKFHNKPNRNFSIDLIKALAKSQSSQISMHDNGLTVRLAIWRSAFDLVKQKPLLGVGTGAETQSLIAKYREKKLEYLVSEKLNSHNQYISFIVTFGIVGFFILSIAYVFQFYTCLKFSNEWFRYYLIFVLLVFITMLTESILNRFHGITLFLLANTMFYLLTTSDET